MCLSRRNVEITCGVEEWAVAMEGAIPKEFDIIGFTSEEEEEEMFNGGVMDVIKETDVIGFTPEVEEMFSDGVMDEIEIGIGLLAQGNIVESSEVDLYAVGDTQILERPEALKMQVYFLYSMLALACLSVFVALLAYLPKHTSNKFYRKKKQNPASETDVLKGSGAVKKPTDNMSTPFAGNSKMHVIQTSEVDFVGESSLTDTTMVDGSSVKKAELRATNVTDTTMAKKSFLKELELQATPTTTTPEVSLEKIERNTGPRGSTKREVSSLRRSNRLRSRVTST